MTPKFTGAAAVLLAAGAGLLWTAEDNPPARIVPLTALAGTAIQPGFSPDGKRVAFAWDGGSGGNVDIYVKTVGSTKVVRLTTDPAGATFPAWSPDGRQIAFASARGGGGIYLVSAEGGPDRKLSDLATDSRPSWTPDGKYLLVAKLYKAARPQAGDGALLLVPIQGAGTPRQILIPPAGTWYKDPALAPDGRSLAFVECRSGSSCGVQSADLGAGMALSSKPRQITDTSWHIFGLAWMPDGASLVFAGNSWQRSTYLWRVNVRNAKEPEQVAPAGEGASYPAVDWKAGRVAFSRNLAHGNLWAMQPGGQLAPVLTTSAIDYAPQYSPDGRRIVFSSNRQGDFALWVAKADGTGAARITHLANPWSGSPRWSPDGRQIAFDSYEKGRCWEIWVVNADGRSPRQLTHGTVDDAVPSWSHDGKWIYFASKRSGTFQIWRMPAGGGAAVQVTRNGGWIAFDSTDGKTLYYTLNNGAVGLYAKRLPSGEEQPFVKEPVSGFAVFSNGLYTLHQIGAGRTEIRFHELPGGKTRVAGEVDNAIISGMAVSPDQKKFLFSKLCDTKADLMLIENFRTHTGH